MAPYIYSLKLGYKYNSIMHRQNKGNREMRNSKKNNGAKVFGRPGSSANSNNALRQVYNNLSWGKKAAIFAVGSVLGALSSLAIGINPLLGGALIAGIILFLSSLFLNKGTWASLIILAAYAFVSIPLGGIIIAPISEAQLVYAVEAGVSLFTAALLAGWLSLRYGRMAPWKILGLALPISSVLGIVAGLLLPGSGINVARVSMFLVVAYGCGVLDWFVSGFQMLKDKFKKTSDEGYSNPLVLSANEQKKILSAAEQKTAATLSESLNSDYTVFHDVVTKQSKSTIAHMVVGPAGLFLVASVAPTGKIVETSSTGLSIPGVEIGKVASNLVEQRGDIAKALKIRTEDVKLVVVAQDVKLGVEGLSRSFAAFESVFAKIPTVNITLVSNDMLAYEVAPGIDLISPATRNVLVHRAQSVLKPSSKRLSTESTMSVAAIDQDGKIVKPSSMEVAEEWLRLGAVAKVAINDQIIDNVRIYLEPYTDDKGESVVGVVLDEEWKAYQSEGKKPEVFTFLVSSVYPS
jgi:hypothetical protein